MSLGWQGNGLRSGGSSADVEVATSRTYDSAAPTPAATLRPSSSGRPSSGKNQEMPEANLDLETGDAGALLLQVLSSVREGDFSVRMPLEWTGVAGKVADGLRNSWAN